MRHKRKGRKLGRRSAHRKQVLRNLASALALNERIITTEGKGKEVKRFMEHLMSIAVKQPEKLDSAEEKLLQVNLIRQVFKELPNKRACMKLFERAKEYDGRKTGFIRIFHLPPRKGDAAHMVLLNWVKTKK